VPSSTTPRPHDMVAFIARLAAFRGRVGPVDPSCSSSNHPRSSRPPSSKPIRRPGPTRLPAARPREVPLSLASSRSSGLARRWCGGQSPLLPGPGFFPHGHRAVPPGRCRQTGLVPAGGGPRPGGTGTSTRGAISGYSSIKLPEPARPPAQRSNVARGALALRSDSPSRQQRRHDFLDRLSIAVVLLQAAGVLQKSACSSSGCPPGPALPRPSRAAGAGRRPRLPSHALMTLPYVAMPRPCCSRQSGRSARSNPTPSSLPPVPELEGRRSRTPLTWGRQPGGRSRTGGRCWGKALASGGEIGSSSSGWKWFARPS